MDDPDASSFTHWLVFDIPAECHDVPSGSRADAVGLSGRNSGGTVGYIGPCPPSGTHLYIFRLFALDVKTVSLIAGASRQQVVQAIAAHTIGTAELMGRYGR
jgi:Raf kinase inhibitor-like YbhB/YbcL family protein